MSVEPVQDAITMVRVVERGEVLNLDVLRLAESVHRQLRPHLAEDYLSALAPVWANGAAMVAAVASGRVRGVAVYRRQHNTFSGLHVYVDDLVTDAASRSRGVGHALMGWLREEALRLGARALILDSGTQRVDAHRFYFREGLVIRSFHFSQELPE